MPSRTVMMSQIMETAAHQATLQHKTSIDSRPYHNKVKVENTVNIFERLGQFDVLFVEVFGLNSKLDFLFSLYYPC